MKHWELEFARPLRSKQALPSDMGCVFGLLKGRQQSQNSVCRVSHKKLKTQAQVMW